jgi:hypothetical protein
MISSSMRRVAVKGAVKTAVAVALTLAAVVSVALSAQGGKVDLTGAWAFETMTEAGPGTPSVTLKQDGDKLTGHYSSQTLGEADLTGTVTGNQFTFAFNADLQGQAVPVVYKGTIESATSLKGTLDVAGGMAGGTFTAKKK